MLDKKEPKKSKFNKCSKCGANTTLMICECGNEVWKQKEINKSKK